MNQLIKEGKFESVLKMLKEGVLPDEVDENGNTPLHNSVRYYKGDSKRMALFYPVIKRDNILIKRLCQYPELIEKKNNFRMTAMDMAIAYCIDIEPARILIEAGGFVQLERGIFSRASEFKEKRSLVSSARMVQELKEFVPWDVLRVVMRFLITK
jgi:hypothetical protein